MEKKLIPEVSTIRAIACLCVVCLHSIMVTVGFALPEDSTLSDTTLLTIAGFLAFGTPTFVFISELILSHAYPNKIPDKFYQKRVTRILLPFVFISFFYPFTTYYSNFSSLIKEFSLNLLGNHQGPWFVLVIMQFYVLHHIFIKYLSKVSPALILILSFVINVSYLGIFNLTAPFSDNGFINYVWDNGYWVPFFAWIFYFCLAHYCGRNYVLFIHTLKKYKYLVLITPVMAVALILYDNSLGLFNYNSKRMDMVLFATAMILTLFLIFSKLKNQPLILDFISRYSFGIFLVHIFCLRVLIKVGDMLRLNVGNFKILLLFPSSVILSVIGIYLLNRLSFGKYLVGNIRTSREVNVNDHKTVGKQRSPRMVKPG